MGAAASLITIAVGAILRFATTIHSATWNIKVLGDILMIVGAVGLVLAGVAYAYWDELGVRGYKRRRSIRSTDIRGVVHGPTGYARTSYDANYPNVAAVPTETVVEEETSVL